MTKKNAPVITHTEVICFAIRHLEHEVEVQEQFCRDNPAAQPMLEHTMKELGPKLEALKEMYRIETGMNY